MAAYQPVEFPPRRTFAGKRRADTWQMREEGDNKSGRQETRTDIKASDVAKCVRSQYNFGTALGCRLTSPSIHLGASGGHIRCLEKLLETAFDIITPWIECVMRTLGDWLEYIKVGLLSATWQPRCT